MKTCYNWAIRVVCTPITKPDFSAPFSSYVEYRGLLMCDCRTSW